MNTLTTYDTFRRIPESMNCFAASSGRFASRRAPVAIRMDVAEHENAYVVKAEIPGVAKDEIQVSIEGNQVTIGAEVKRESDVKDGERVLRSERYFGSVYRGVHPAGGSRRDDQQRQVRERRARAHARQEAGRTRAAS